MRYSVQYIIDIPYALFRRRTIRVQAEDLDSLIREAIPRRACRELEVIKETIWKKIGWKHVNMKFCFHNIQIEFVFDQEKKDVAAVYFSNNRTGELLSYSDPPLKYKDINDESRLAEEVAIRADEAL